MSSQHQKPAQPKQISEKRERDGRDEEDPSIEVRLSIIMGHVRALEYALDESNTKRSKADVYTNALTKRLDRMHDAHEALKQMHVNETFHLRRRVSDLEDHAYANERNRRRTPEPEQEMQNTHTQEPREPREPRVITKRSRIQGRLSPVYTRST